MRDVKDTKRATVRVGFDGRVHKQYHGFCADKRFENEVRVLRFLEENGCDFVPRVVSADEERLILVTTNCGQIVEKLSESKLKELFGELESFGVRHGDPFARNVTYDGRQGRFCIIDFEFATIPSTGEGLTIEDLERLHRQEADQ